MAMRIVFGDWAEKRGLLGDLLAVADQNDLRVGGIKVAASGGENIVGSERMDFLAIRFQIVLGQAIEVDRRKLAETAILRGDAERKTPVR